MFIKELEARVTWALASLVTPMHSQCIPLVFSNSLALVFFSQRSKLPRNLLLFQTQVLQSSINQNKPGKNASQTVSYHSFAYGITGTTKKLSASTWFSYIGKTNPFAPALPVPFNCQQHLPFFPDWTHLPWYTLVVTLINMLCIIGLCIPIKQNFTEH